MNKLLKYILISAIFPIFYFIFVVLSTQFNLFVSESVPEFIKTILWVLFSPSLLIGALVAIILSANYLLKNNHDNPKIGIKKYFKSIVVPLSFGLLLILFSLLFLYFYGNEGEDALGVIMAVMFSSILVAVSLVVNLVVFLIKRKK